MNNSDSHRASGDGLVDVGRLRELLAKATTLPWRGDLESYPLGDTGDADCPFVIRNQDDNRIVEIFERYGPGLEDCYENDGRLITEAINALPALLTEIEHLRASNGGMREALTWAEIALRNRDQSELDVKALRHVKIALAALGGPALLDPYTGEIIEATP